ncbi:MAG: c-type cytochrome [Georgfuchsia sp.]
MSEAMPKADAPNPGVVASVRGSVVDIRFDARLPPIYSLLHAMEGKIVIEVLAQLDARHVRGIALTPTQGLARGMTVEDRGGPFAMPAYGKKLTDQEIADVASYIRNAWGNRAAVVGTGDVAKVRAEVRQAAAQ